MELLDRYLQAVKRYLPGQRQDDILAELRANLESQLDEKEGEMGRPLTSAEGHAWVKQLGSPMQMAARYQRQQYLIGPAIFPVYWFVLKMALFWATVIYLAVDAVLIALNSATAGIALTSAIGAVARVPSTLIITAAWVTLIFAVLEFVSIHYHDKMTGLSCWQTEWDPSSLPVLEMNPKPVKKWRSYAKAVAEVIFGALFLVWLFLVPQHPFLVFGPGVWYMQVSRFQLAPVWITFYWLIVALNILQLVWRVSDLWSGAWQEPRRLQQIIFKAFGLVSVLLLATAPNHVLVSLKHPLMDQERLGGTVDAINRSTHLAFTLVCVIIALQLLWEIGQAGWVEYRRRVAEG